MNTDKLIELGFKPQSMFLSSTGAQAIDKLRGCFLITAISDTVFASIRSYSTRNDSDLDNITLLAGHSLYIQPHTVKLTSGSCMLYFDKELMQ